MIRNFTPDYTNIEQAARNIDPKRLPIYEHAISSEIMEKIMGKNFRGLSVGDDRDLKEYFRIYCYFYKTMCYDCVSFEGGVSNIMPGSGALGGHAEGVIKIREDFEKYPWEEITDLYFKKYSRNIECLKSALPQGMKIIGGVGNGVFECVQDIVGYSNLCYMSVDDPDLYRDLFVRVGGVIFEIWDRFLRQYAESFAVCRFGDDLGFKSQTLISVEDIKAHIIPQYKKIICLIHSYDKPFLLHSCGNIFDVMDDLIDGTHIDAKHSNEDQIAPFSVWVERYGDRIGNFGGVDTDVLCSKSEQEIKSYTSEVVDYSINHKGFALGSGNSIPEYVPVEGYLAMIEAANEKRS